MHTQPMQEHDGVFSSQEEKPICKCPRCGKFSVYCKTWESSCGGYIDDKFICRECGYKWWVDGIDS